ncbi:MAG: hypothetical protein ACK5AL_14235 [Planctomycetota bacterium]|jgi:hypothetical protein
MVFAQRLWPSGASDAVEDVGCRGCFRTSVALDHASAFRADRRLLGLVGWRSSSRTWRAALRPGVALILQASVLDSDAPLGLTLTNDLDVTFD